MPAQSSHGLRDCAFFDVCAGVRRLRRGHTSSQGSSWHRSLRSTQQCASWRLSDFGVLHTATLLLCIGVMLGCPGPPGADGADEADRAEGVDGTNGVDGSGGIVMAPISHCLQFGPLAIMPRQKQSPISPLPAYTGEHRPCQVIRSGALSNERRAWRMPNAARFFRGWQRRSRWRRAQAATPMGIRGSAPRC